ncbi:GyrI-like domain-containing protein [Enterococcus sp. LJL99]
MTTQGIMPEAMIQMYRKFYNEWLPVADYEYDCNADIEVYPMYLEETNDYELWLPIKRKKGSVAMKSQITIKEIEPIRVA